MEEFCKKVFLSGEIPSELYKKIRNNLVPMCEATFSFVHDLSAEEKNRKFVTILTNFKGILITLINEIESLKNP